MQSQDRKRRPGRDTQAFDNKKESGKIICIKAKPDSLAMNASNTAIIVVDMENDFCTKGGMMDRAGNNISVIQKIIDPITKF
jgi:ureidoacrylate peracid hydrolase